VLAEFVAPAEVCCSVAPSQLVDDFGRLCLRSFSADTEVLMADGTTTVIADVRVGDEVWAMDPETGDAGNRTVTAVWPHQDVLMEYTVGDGSITTTEDHHFWNATDDEWQEAQLIDRGDSLLTADGQVVAAGNLDWTTAHFAAAYDITVDDLHSYFVATGDSEVLVHNCNGVYEASAKHHPNVRGNVSPAPTNGQAALDLSVQVKTTSPRRVAFEPSSGEFVVLDQTTPGVFHGHSRPWAELHTDMQNVLVDQGVVNRRGRPIG